MRDREGFTLIEIMIVVAIIAILAAIALPKIEEAVRRSVEGKTKANLAVLREAIVAYAGDHDGPPTDDLTSLVSGGYLKEIPWAEEPPYHPLGNGVCPGPISAATLDPCRNAYAYDNNPADGGGWGDVVLTCTHLDLHGNPWSSY